jgi:hypothetical protein
MISKCTPSAHVIMTKGEVTHRGRAKEPPLIEATEGNPRTEARTELICLYIDRHHLTVELPSSG